MMTTLYLSRLVLNPASRRVRRDLGDPYELHRTVMGGFEGWREAAGALHRLEMTTGGGLVLLVQSVESPDWSALTEGGYLPAAEALAGWDNPAVKAFDPAPRVGDVLRFRLRANPTVKKKRDGRLSNRVPLVRAEEQAAWLARQGEQHGFDLLQLEMRDEQTEEGRVRSQEASPALKVFSVQFDGLLRVRDEAGLARAVRQGIGPAKAFGCGLLSLARAA